MAANEYFNSHPIQQGHGHGYNQPHNPFEQKPPAPPPSSTKPSVMNWHPNSSSQSYGDDTYGHGYSGAQHTSQPQPTAYSSTSMGRTDDPNQYEDNIPLKSNVGVSTTADQWHKQNTQYNPASIEEDHRPMVVPEKSRRSKFFKGRIPYVVFFLSLVQTAVFIGEIVKNAVLTGSPIAIHPSFNYMIGPSTQVLINMGARYVPCMRTISEIQNSSQTILWPCPNTTTSESECTLSQLCGLGGINFEHPNQWFRFITPMFLHAGIIHIGVNMLMQMTMGREMEKQIGSLRFASVYISSGIFGFVLGANFAGEGTASTGASGALFGIMGLYLLDLFYNWRERRKPVRDLMFSLLDIVIAFVLGLIPGVVDNFSHMGGLLMGLVLGICLLHSPNALRERLGTSTSYHPMNPTNPASPTQESPEEGFTAFKKKPVGFFKGRKPLWWAWWLLRAGAVVGVFVCFIVLLNNFYKYRNTCSWCKYLSCLPIKDWCESGDLQLSNSTSKRDLFGVSGQRFYVFYE